MKIKKTLLRSETKTSFKQNCKKTQLLFNVQKQLNSKTNFTQKSHLFCCETGETFSMQSSLYLRASPDLI